MPRNPKQSNRVRYLAIKWMWNKSSVVYRHTAQVMSRSCTPEQEEDQHSPQVAAYQQTRF